MITQSGECDYRTDLQNKEKKLREIVMGMPVNEESAKRCIGLANGYIEFLDDTHHTGDNALLARMLEIFDLYHQPYIKAGAPFNPDLRLRYEVALDVAERAGLKEHKTNLAGSLNILGAFPAASSPDP
ncbi:hypothetical protein COV19_01275 [Candidatus Woesearchaeota archaeon CG10_big_fil_rev_8_21_14_0_10_44_13]|nr:MAG: hypothetical protein COV19_01275 [Candidatus Woesearchaeota archaeon CG10_big_fil_rev_8_21_14_0_10_44_13]